MQLHFLLSYTLFSCFQASAPHHIVFEEIGEMAGAISYIHAIVPVNITGLLQTVYWVQQDRISLQPDSRSWTRSGRMNI